jgi:alcohol dehydrogenase
VGWLTELALNVLGSYAADVFDQGIPGHQSGHTVDVAVELARDLKADLIASVGGGSVIDIAEAVANTLHEGGKTIDHIGVMRTNHPVIPHVVIPPPPPAPM